MDLQLSDKVAIVTGASRGIGRAIARTLGAEGMHLVVAARSRDQLDQLATALPVRCLVQAVDLREAGATAAGGISWSITPAPPGAAISSRCRTWIGTMDSG